AYPKIHQFSPSVSVGGPINGYDYWDTLGFGAAMTKFIDGLISANAHLPDHLDWHVYTKDTDKLLGTVSGVQGIYSARNLTAPKIVLSEINRNSVVSGDGQPQSADDNTGWPSVSWLSYVYDKLQAAGVDQAFYFCLHETTLGLISRDYDVVRPNYYTMWAMTNQMGRHRLAVDDLSGSKLGAIATNDGDVRRLFIYNTNTDDTGDAYITLGNTLIHQTLTFTKTWYGNNSGIPTDAKISLPQWSHPPANGQILVPAGGWVILDLTPPSIYRLKNASGNFSYALKKDINPVPTGWTIDEKVGSVVTTDNGVAPSGMVPLYHFNNASTGEDLLLTSLALKLSWYQNSANGFVGTQMGYVYSSATAAPTGAAHLYQAGSRNGGNNHLYTNDLQEYKGLGINSWIMQGTLFYFVPQ
ncbi:MAG TPA: hypothetical protein VN132_11055, partial [Bdellovibrio sp.]|nr:hypothetical protein [Bdellovibrio sp.]